MEIVPVDSLWCEGQHAIFIEEGWRRTRDNRSRLLGKLQAQHSPLVPKILPGRRRTRPAMKANSSHSKSQEDCRRTDKRVGMTQPAEQARVLREWHTMARVLSSRQSSTSHARTACIP